jgi:hypothetical protein
MATNNETNLQMSLPNPALKRLEKLVGKWELRGRNFDSNADNITGWTTFEWMPGEFFLQAVGEMNFKGFLIKSVEIIGYDPESKTFPSHVYSNMSGTMFPYSWDIQGNTVRHSGLGATYSGNFSEDGNTLTGGWRPDEGAETTDGSAYDAVMTRVK